MTVIIPIILFALLFIKWLSHEKYHRLTVKNYTQYEDQLFKDNVFERFMQVVWTMGPFFYPNVEVHGNPCNTNRLKIEFGFIVVVWWVMLVVWIFMVW